MDTPKEAEQSPVRDRPLDEVVEALADSGDGDRAGKLDGVQGSPPESRLGNATPGEPQHGPGSVDTEDQVPRRGDGLGEHPAPAAEIDDDAFPEAGARQRFQEDGSGAPRDFPEAGVVDVSEVAAVEQGGREYTPMGPGSPRARMDSLVQ